LLPFNFRGIIFRNTATSEKSNLVKTAGTVYLTSCQLAITASNYDR
jgi:hypothetical protein